MVASTQWLEAGDTLITEQGKQALTIAALCKSLNLSKGSFYHHFKSLEDYLTALEAHLQQQGKAVSPRKDSVDDKKKPWFETALKLLKKTGYASITLDELNSQMGVTKGAFYYLFKNRDSFVEELLAYWEKETLGSILDMATQDHADLQTVDDILTLSQQLSHRRDIDVQIRAWALVDKNVARFQKKLDAHQLNACKKVINTLFTLDEDTLDAMAKVAYFSYIGSQQFLPKVSEKEWADSLKKFLPLFSTL